MLFFALFSANQPAVVMKWSDHHDAILLREIILQAPWSHRRGSTERGEIWTKISESLNTLENPHFRVAQRSVRDRFALLEKKYKNKVREEERASGISPEESEFDRALQDIISRMEEADTEAARLSDEKKKTAEVELGKAEEMRKVSLETFKETQKRNEAAGDSDSEPSKKKKKKRASGSDTMSFLRGRADVDNQLKTKELELKKLQFEKDNELKAKELRIRRQEQQVQMQQAQQAYEMNQTLLQQQQQHSALLMALFKKMLDK